MDATMMMSAVRPIPSQADVDDDDLSISDIERRLRDAVDSSGRLELLMSARWTEEEGPGGAARRGQEADDPYAEVYDEHPDYAEVYDEWCLPATADQKQGASDHNPDACSGHRRSSIGESSSAAAPDDRPSNAEACDDHPARRAQEGVETPPPAAPAASTSSGRSSVEESCLLGRDSPAAKAGSRRNLSGEPHPDQLDGLSVRVKGLRSSLQKACSSSPFAVADEDDGDETTAVGASRRGSVGALRSVAFGGGGRRQRRGPRRHSFMGFGSSVDADAGGGGGGAMIAGRFVESASFLVSALCGLADSHHASIVVPGEEELAGLWEHTSNVDTALCGIGPILLSIIAAADPNGGGSGHCDDDVLVKKVARMARLIDSMSETVRRVTDETTTWNEDVECCFGTLSELLCLTCIQTIKSACNSANAGAGVSRRRRSSLLSKITCSEELVEEQQVSWRISDALSRTWAVAGQGSKLTVLCSDIGDMGLCEVESDLFVELSLLVLRSLEWAPHGICDAMEEELKGRGFFLDGVKREGYSDLYCAQTLACLGNAHASMGQYDMALSHYEESLHIRELNLGENHYQVADVHKSLGNVYYLLGRHEAADAQYARAMNSLELCDADCPASDETYVSVLLLRSNLKARLGQTCDAISLLGICLEIQRASLGETHPDLADTLKKRAALQLDAHRDEEALEDFWAALHILKAVHGDDDEVVGDTLHDMGMLLWGQRDREGAMELLSEALWIRGRQSGTRAESSETRLARAETQAAIASIHRSAKRTGHAVRMYESCLEIWRSELGDDDVKVADARVALGHSYVDLGNFASARGHYLDGLSILERIQQAQQSDDGRPECGNNSRGGDDGVDNKLTHLLFFLANLELRDGHEGPAREFLERFVHRKRSSGRGRDPECTRALRVLASMDRAAAIAARAEGSGCLITEQKATAAAVGEVGRAKRRVSLPKVEKMRSPFRDALRKGVFPLEKSGVANNKSRISSIEHRTVGTAASTATFRTARSSAGSTAASTATFSTARSSAGSSGQWRN